MAKPNGNAPKHFDWARAHERLAHADAAWGTGSLGADEVRRRLKQRAMDLAAVPAEAAATARHADYIAFRIGTQRYAVETEQVSEVIECATTVPLPGVPPLFRGLVSHGGAVYPLVDLQPLLGLGREDAVTPRFALLVTAAESAVAFAAEAIDGLQRLDSATLAVTAESASVHPAVIGTVADSLTVLDLSRLIFDARLTVHEEPRAGASI